MTGIDEGDGSINVQSSSSFLARYIWREVTRTVLATLSLFCPQKSINGNHVDWHLLKGLIRAEIIVRFLSNFAHLFFALHLSCRQKHHCADPGKCWWRTCTKRFFCYKLKIKTAKLYKQKSVQIFRSNIGKPTSALTFDWETLKCVLVLLFLQWCAIKQNKFNEITIYRSERLKCTCIVLV